MGKYAKLTSAVLFIVYILITFYFTNISIEVFEISGLNEFLKELHAIFDDISNKMLIAILSAIATFIIIISFLVQFIIAKFLLMIFFPNIKSDLSLILAPKIFIAINNILFIQIGEIYNSSFYTFTAFIGSFLILFLFQYNVRNWKASILFATPFIADPLFSLVTI
ncbi:hypothetical protein GGQ92_001151 [Gracilibacillus halotolerans]|uniref:Uncharacterized protein n=1 Tax=Gracilibacillus halotolerans TaxID=74386 RepID=A0A841RNX5_9BACI|nr:hypothetical protein [Gracilibacillus halotolerans]MBB6512368.1 hypothetical protein [Gracilibacillus halotolerans]